MNNEHVIDFYSQDNWASTLEEQPFDLVTFLLGHVNLPKAVFHCLLDEAEA